MAFNVAVTAWQLCDWVFNDLSPSQRDELHIHMLGDLQAAAREQCRALHLCRQIATASKHWEITKYADPDVEVIVTASPMPPPTNAAWHIYIVDGSHKVTAAEVFDRALEFWTSYIFQNGVARNELGGREP